MVALLWKTIVMGIVEGLTEFLPVSSTGHLILLRNWLHIPKEDPFWDLFDIFIQLGAIFAVVVFFWRRLLGLLNIGIAARGNVRESAAAGQVGRLGRGAGVEVLAMTPRARQSRRSPLLLVIIATIPVLIVGKLFGAWVEKHFMAADPPWPIVWALIVGGVVMILVEFVRPNPKTETLEDVSIFQAIFVGFGQCLAVLFPGTSRSAATIIPGMAVGMTRAAAAELSFFLAVPAMFAAGFYKLYKFFKEQHILYPDKPAMTADQALLLVIGTLVSFLVAWLVIGMFMAYVRRRSFLPFALYRIALGVAVYFLVKQNHP